MPVKRVRVEAVGSQGEGLARLSRRVIFLPFTAPGDEVEIRFDLDARGRPQVTGFEIVKPAPDRAEAICSHFGACGGCALQHLAAKQYADWIAERIRRPLATHGVKAHKIRYPAISPAGARRRLTLTAAVGEGRAVIGFNKRQSHDIVDIHECPVARPALVSLIAPLRKALGQAIETPARIRLTLTQTDGGIDLLIDSPVAIGREGRAALAAFAQDNGIAALTADIDGAREIVAQIGRPEMRFSNAMVPLPPGGFIQVTAEGEAALVEAVREAVGSARRVADLFAGLGTFTFPLAERAQVTAVEGAAALIEALDQGARSARGLKPVLSEHRDLFRRPLSKADLEGFDAVVFDPPRAGAPGQAAALADSGVKRVVAVSCNPNTFGRDAELLVKGGYHLKWVQPVGQFLYSHHVELAAHFRR